MIVEFKADCLKVLIHSLVAVNPYEGCALLLGNHKQSASLQKKNSLEVQMIWPCCNSWEPEIMRLRKSPQKLSNFIKEDLSKVNRFLIDPREQLLAQRWARTRNWKILGSAHSHPNGPPIPSDVDRYWTFAPGLMVIIGKFATIRAWWMVEDQTFHPKELAILGTK